MNNYIVPVFCTINKEVEADNIEEARKLILNSTQTSKDLVHALLDSSDNVSIHIVESLIKLKNA